MSGRIDVLAVLGDVSEHLTPYVDVVDGDYGTPAANTEMVLRTELDAARVAVDELFALGRCVVTMPTLGNLQRFNDALRRCGGAL